eukprot:15363557-Ditylum_brightwellii.AAC.1
MSCTSSKNGYAWSLQLIRAGREVQYWKMCRSSLKNRVDFEYLATLAKVLEMEEDTNLTLDKINGKLTHTRKNLKTIQKNAAAVQDTHLEEMAQMQLKKRKGNLAAIIKNIKHCEELKLVFQQMKLITKGKTGGTVQVILVLNPKLLCSFTMYVEVLGSLKFQHEGPYMVMDD